MQNNDPGSTNWYGMTLICVVTVFNYVDRSILAVLLEPIGREFALSDTQLGLLTGIAFGLTYAVLGIVISLWADVGNRRLILGWALAIWTVTTALCGVTQNFWQLFTVRMGVGIGEAAGGPVCHSLATDYFPARRHSEAASYLASATMVGSILGVAGGGVLAEAYGWRVTFLLVGGLGVFAALLVLKTLPEPRTRTRIPGMSEIFGAQSLAVIKSLLLKRTFVLLLLGFSSISLLSLGLQQWGPSFMVRSFHLSLGRVGLVYGAVVNGSLLIGALLGGRMMARLSQHGLVWLVRAPALGCLLAVPCYAIAFTSHSLLAFVVSSFAGGLLLGAATPPIYACIYGIAGSARRATAIALVLLFFNLLGLGFGPLIIGFLSDTLRALVGQESLRYSLLAIVCVLPLTSYLFYACERSVAQDYETDGNGATPQQAMSAAR